MKHAGEIMEILEAFDLVGSYRGAAELAGCDHHTVRHYVARGDAGLAPEAGLVRASIIDGFVRHEVPHHRVGMKGLHRRPVAAGR